VPPAVGNRLPTQAREPRLDVDAGPYLFCDYWASAFGLRSIIRGSLLERGLLSLDHFRRAIDRPRTRLPKLRYYILAFVLLPALFPYKVVYDIMRLLQGRAEKVDHPVDRLMGQYRLDVDPGEEGRVSVRTRDQLVADKLIDPRLVGVDVSFFYPTYKLLIAGLCMVILAMGVVPLLWRLELLSPLKPYFEVVLISLVFLSLLLIFRDLLTAILAPLPILAVRYLMLTPDSRGGLLVAAVGFILLYYMVEWFFLPRPLPPRLFLYVNDPRSEFYPYQREHAPYWLDGSHYWVWRFVVYAPGELTKFWEKDWERVEVWLRADGEQAGEIEWVVYDCHYRELWFSYDRLMSQDRRAMLEWRFRQGLAAGRRLDWVIETDMDLLFHAPFVRGVFLEDADHGRPWHAVTRLFQALRIRPRPDRFEHYEQRLDDLESEGAEFLDDVPEHLRRLALKMIMRMPWDYWRYPLGAKTPARRRVYEDFDAAQSRAAAAADPRYQVKCRLRRPEIV
jgi:hypothetical protein